MSKIIITSTGNTIDSKFDKRFGRAAWFCLYEKDSKLVSFHENEFMNANGGAGTKAAEKMMEFTAGKVISGDFGPKAKDLLEKLKIQMVIMQDDDLTVKDIIEKIN